MYDFLTKAIYNKKLMSHPYFLKTVIRHELLSIYCFLLLSQFRLWKINFVELVKSKIYFKHLVLLNAKKKSMRCIFLTRLVMRNKLFFLEWPYSLLSSIRTSSLPKFTLSVLRFKPGTHLVFNHTMAPPHQINFNHQKLGHIGWSIGCGGAMVWSKTKGVLCSNLWTDRVNFGNIWVL